MIYDYVATLEKVISGDTVDLKVDLGFGIYTVQRMMFANIVAPNVHTQEGRDSKRALELLLGTQEIFISTKRVDFGGNIKYYFSAAIKNGNNPIIVSKYMVNNGFAKLIPVTTLKDLENIGY